MIKLPIPDIMRDDIYALTPDMFTARDVRLVFLDVDNTIMPYGQNKVPQRLIGWADGMRDGGVELFILSNNRGERPSIFARALGIEYIGKAFKPGCSRMLGVCKEKGVPPERCAVVGDQIYTDVLCAKRAGAIAVLLRPIKLTNPLLAIRYALELPFRLAGRYRKEK